MKRTGRLMLVAIVFCSFLQLTLPSFAAPPKFINIASYPIGSLGTVLATAFSNTIEKKTGIKSRPIPADTQVGRVVPLKTGEAVVAVLAASTLYYASHGIQDFATANWGPQKFRLVFNGHAMEHGMAVRANSGIKTWADLKGKKVTDPAGIFRESTLALLAYGNVKREEVIWVKASGYTDALRLVMDGVADACHATPSSPAMKEWETTHGLRWLPMDPKDKNAWERMAEVAPYMARAIWTEAGALGEGGPKWLAYYPNTLACLDNASEEVIYMIVKALVEGYDLYKNVQPPATTHWSVKDTLDLGKPVFVPFHPGFVKYAKEVGAWTQEHEAWQKNALKEEAERIKNWKPPEKK